MIRVEFKKDVENLAFQYYQGEMNKLTDLSLVSLKLYDFEGNSTKTISLNEESLAALIELFNKMQAKKEAV